MNSDSKHKSNAPAPEPPAPATPAPVPVAPPSPPSVPASTDAEYNIVRVAKMFKKTDDDASVTADTMLTPAPVGNVAAAASKTAVRSEYPSPPSASILSTNVSTRKKRRKGENRQLYEEDEAFYTPDTMLTPAPVGNIAAAASKTAVRSEYTSSPSASILSTNVSTRKKRRKGENRQLYEEDEAFYTPEAMLTPAQAGNVAAAASKIAPVRSNFPSFMRQI